VPFCSKAEKITKIQEDELFEPATILLFQVALCSQAERNKITVTDNTFT
jgi:hypothetical protein